MKFDYTDVTMFIVLFILISIGIMAGCKDEHAYNTKTSENVISKTQVPYGSHSVVDMKTVEHDDHWFVICLDYFIHHPNCPCKE